MSVSFPSTKSAELKCAPKSTTWNPYFPFIFNKSTEFSRLKTISSVFVDPNLNFSHEHDIKYITFVMIRFICSCELNFDCAWRIIFPWVVTLWNRIQIPVRISLLLDSVKNTAPRTFSSFLDRALRMVLRVLRGVAVMALWNIAFDLAIQLSAVATNASFVCCSIIIFIRESNENIESLP